MGHVAFPRPRRSIRGTTGQNGLARWQAQAPEPPVSAGGPAGSRPVDGGQPRLRGRRAEPGVDLEGLRHDGGDGPAVAEGGAQLLLADPPGPDVARLAVAEA